MKTDLFQSCGHCLDFQICWHTECSTFTASSFRIWNSSTQIPSPPLALLAVMLSKTHLTSHSRMSGSRWVITPLWWFYEDLQDLLELTPQNNALFIIGNWNAKVGLQETPAVTGKFDLGVQNEAGQRLIEFFQENALVIANTFFQEHKRRHYTWASPDGQHWNQIDYIVCSQRWRSSIQSEKQHW